ncbi:hypothetical protein [Parendozoicomonas sp. Alg238-R29]|uniref:hypothetical protein n=1 Tax=Parendozoicomonas sp. Alg238-R29 TaxID=2993446 RepID=UPI00248E67DA|nr:hypothetical protein [Parendozoicomonas sp. Alg238-R29]
MPDIGVEQVREAKAELQDAWENRDWSKLMTREKSVRLLAENIFASQVPDGELRKELFSLQQQYLDIVTDMNEERAQLKELLIQSGSRLNAVQQYRMTGQLKNS